jgi:Domain of unknown function (DUF4062)
VSWSAYILRGCPCSGANPRSVGHGAVPAVIEVMVSSTVNDLLRDRDAIVNSIGSVGVTRFIGIEPIKGPSYGSSGYSATMEMAERCHLYVLVLGGRYGYVSNRGKSATELEFDAAYREDPTKILVFRKELTSVDARQAEFIARVSDYHKGYYIRNYRRPLEVGDLALSSFREWLRERAALGIKLHYFDHFVRLAIQRLPFPGVHPSYTVVDDHLELRYRILGRIYIVHFDKAQIYNDFWGSIANLENRFDEWRRDHYGRNS